MNIGERIRCRQEQCSDRTAHTHCPCNTLSKANRMRFFVRGPKNVPLVLVNDSLEQDSHKFSNKTVQLYHAQLPKRRARTCRRSTHTRIEPFLSNTNAVFYEATS